MLNDHNRNSILESAIREAGVEGKTVFEIGSGAGLTAMLFALHGAREVITCEIDPQLYQIALQVFSTNGLADRITLLNKSSQAIIRDGDLPFTPDFIFTETLDCGIVGEGFASIKDDIVALSGANTVVLPSQIVQYGYLAAIIHETGLLGSIAWPVRGKVAFWRTRPLPAERGGISG